jgi:hypothetical protein
MSYCSSIYEFTFFPYLTLLNMYFYIFYRKMYFLINFVCISYKHTIFEKMEINNTGRPEFANFSYTCSVCAAALFQFC